MEMNDKVKSALKEFIRAVISASIAFVTVAITQCNF